MKELRKFMVIGIKKYNPQRKDLKNDV
jgi:hypothetical protein